ncbi:Uu.00g116430.m01.CDS01 [Anthostomella pinea]|uniref:Uu.00g116430.m01.CDS01 n=1 Tax=Anthostomella pinea TaxID=933095 RepID=A0AAI8VG02_9PEZI|nr:Uu.00g116430.m01.CDS01 [Anthostomella pinea]
MDGQIMDPNHHRHHENHHYTSNDHDKPPPLQAPPPPEPEPESSPPSQAGSSTLPHYFPLEPVSGATLLGLEVARREGLARKGRLKMGCGEVDEAALMGGLERGGVVGVSAEEGDFGMLLGLQTIAHSLVFPAPPTTNSNENPSSDSKTTPPPRPRAAIITILPATTILPTLRDVIKAQVQIKLGPASPGVVDAEVRRCLELISLSRVFDIEGLWQVLGELEDQAQAADTAAVPDDGGEEEEIPTAAQRQLEDDEEEADEGAGNGGPPDEPEGYEPPESSLSSPPESSPEPTAAVLPPLRIGIGARPGSEVVLDSEDEDELSLVAPSSASPAPIPTPVPDSTAAPEPTTIPPPPPAPPSASPNPSTHPQPQSQPPLLPSAPPKSRFASDQPLPVPDIILITHFSSLLTALFTQREKPAAHTSLQLLASHLRYLARSAGPLVLLLNSTTSPLSSSSSSSTCTGSTGTHATPGSGPGGGGGGPGGGPVTPNHPHQNNQPQRPLEPTLRSIFNPAPLPNPGSGSATTYGAAAASLSRRNKPAFGVTFAQFLDVHLLCTRVPRARGDAERVFAPPPALRGGGVGVGVGVGAGGGVGVGQGAGQGEGLLGVRYVWVVEALLDEMGVWKGGAQGQGLGQGQGGKGNKEGKKTTDGEAKIPKRRMFREQRWGAVDVRNGVRVVDALEGWQEQHDARYQQQGPVRLAAGFGVRRV